MKLGVKKIEYLIFDNLNGSEWQNLPFVSLTSTISETWKTNEAGEASTVTVVAEIRKSSKETDDLLKKIMKYCYQFKVTDMRGVEYLLGNEEYFAKMIFTREIDKISVNTYKINISYESPNGLSASE